MRFLTILGLSLLLSGCAAVPVKENGPKTEATFAALRNIDHVLIVILENRSFHNLLANFPGAQGGQVLQTDREGKIYETLPPVMDTRQNPPVIDARFPQKLPNAPSPIDAYVPKDQLTGDLVHRFYQQQAQINGGKMDRFAAISNAGGLVMGTYDMQGTHLWRLAEEFTLADNFFQGAFGGSFINHLWLICACQAEYKNAPDSLRAKLDGDGQLLADGPVTPDGYAVNTLLPPHPLKPATAPEKILPLQTKETVGDQLSARGVSWAWYAGGWQAAEAGRPDPLFQFHHQPFAYFKNYAKGTAARAAHLRDEKDLYAAIARNRLPAVSFFKPVGKDNQHPAYSGVASGDAKLGRLIDTLRQSKAWEKTLVIVTYDENGGYWDPIAPPKGDRFGPGARIPTLLIGPMVKRGFVDHTLYDTTSILNFLGRRFDLPPLDPARQAAVGDLTEALALPDLPARATEKP